MSKTKAAVNPVQGELTYVHRDAIDATKQTLRFATPADRDNYRKSTDHLDLTNAIRAAGLLQNLILQPDARTLAAGGRRFMAIQDLNPEEYARLFPRGIACLRADADVDASLVELMENIHQQEVTNQRITIFVRDVWGTRSPEDIARMVCKPLETVMQFARVAFNPPAFDAMTNPDAAVTFNQAEKLAGLSTQKQSDLMAAARRAVEASGADNGNKAKVLRKVVTRGTNAPKDKDGNRKVDSWSSAFIAKLDAQGEKVNVDKALTHADKATGKEVIERDREPKAEPTSKLTLKVARELRDAAAGKMKGNDRPSDLTAYLAGFHAAMQIAVNYKPGDSPALTDPLTSETMYRSLGIMVAADGKFVRVKSKKS